MMSGMLYACLNGLMMLRVMSRWMGALKANGLRRLNQVSERKYGRVRLYMFGCFIKKCTRLKIESRHGLYVGVYVVT
ncbi:hypothetical protein HanXRQr2_Chr17g0823561 [Helianthus annuus]|uniref:Secreted protein n=1 Tax=Helianthus annuus TaxID=4232 RepID=A0A9K3GW56_HELAN|nr:hypothetical protein HanXRQr2_Chr17g0823561 [Helianthus annuus]KAJ0435494.1 hypothetical protein HanIR_Chr17g0893901 [Helianthus annuus]KAJ0814882.1 hypothetical protein HanPSC8_Chr17g0790981 [Helianthus annuus]